jgi:hypothetical protein
MTAETKVCEKADKMALRTAVLKAALKVAAMEGWKVDYWVES